jgi:hypothetical protein
VSAPTIAQTCGLCACGCGRPLVGRHVARGLSGACYARIEARYRRGRSDELLDFPRRSRSRDELLDEWARLAGEVSREAFAARVGMSLEGFERALYRARADGDARAVMGRRR